MKFKVFFALFIVLTATLTGCAYVPAVTRTVNDATYGVDDKYIFPKSQVRVRVGQCIMSGETVTCDFTLINAGDDTRVFVHEPSIIDNTGMSYKTSFQSQYVKAGEAATFNLKFNYVNTSATSLKFTARLHRLHEASSDFLRFTMPIVK